MTRTFLRTKLHRATITAADPDYEGSVSIDRELCRAAGLLEFEQVDIYDITNGVRFTTYVIYGEPGQVQVNGAAAHLFEPGDKAIIMHYALMTEAEYAENRPTVLIMNEDNTVREVMNYEPQLGSAAAMR